MEGMLGLIPLKCGGVKPKFGIIRAFILTVNLFVIMSQLQQALENRRPEHVQETLDPTSQNHIKFEEVTSFVGV